MTRMIIYDSLRTALTALLLLLLGLQSEVRRVILRRVAKHLHRQIGLGESVLSGQRAQIGHPLLALRHSGADGAGAVPAGQHAGGRRVGAELALCESSRLGERARQAEAGEKLQLRLLMLVLLLVLLVVLLLLQLQLQNVLHGKRRGGRSDERAGEHRRRRERELTEDNQAPRGGTRAARKRKSTPGSGEPWKLLAQVEGKWRPCSCNIPSDSAVAVAAGLRRETERSILFGWLTSLV